jgi:CheY-like chemotaxis protein
LNSTNDFFSLDFWYSAGVRTSLRLRRESLTKKIINKSETIMNFAATTHNNFSIDQPLQGMKILLVEDSPDNQLLLKMIICKTGAKLDIASDGLEGVFLARKNDYSAILMDLHMPNMDGHEATKVLRDEGFQKPIIALTAYTLTEERRRCLESGFSNFLSKPIKRTELYRVLEDIHWHAH